MATPRIVRKSLSEGVTFQWGKVNLRQSKKQVSYSWQGSEWQTGRIEHWYNEAFVRVSEIVLLGIEWNRAIGLVVALFSEGGEWGTVFSSHEPLVQIQPSCKDAACVCDLGVAYVVGLWPLGHFQLNRTPSVTHPSI